MKTYFVNIDSITNEEINTIKTATEDDKIVFFYKGDGMIPMSLHIALTEINAKVVFHNVDSDAELFFYIGHEFNNFGETVILSGINIPETIKKIICPEKEKTRKKRTPRTKTVKSSKEEESPILIKNEPEKPTKVSKKENKTSVKAESVGAEQKPEQKPSQKNTEEKSPAITKDFPKKKSKKPTSYWLAGETSKSFFSGSCKLERDYPDRENIVEIAGRCFGEEANVNEALKRLAKETSREIADIFAQNANMLTSAFKDNFNKRVDTIEY